MDKNNIRSKVVKESLMDYDNLATILKENTADAVKGLLNEAVKETYTKLLSEDYDEDEVEDTEDQVLDADAAGAEEAPIEGGDEGMDATADDLGDDMSVDAGVEAADDLAGADEDEWAQYDKYKNEDGEYDLSNAEDEDVVKVYKLLKNGDNVLVKQEDNGTVKLQDNEAGTEYLISMNDSDDDVDSLVDDTEIEIDGMNESQEKLFELVLEYDSNVGYTDNYQDKDVMTNDGMAEPSKNTNDWDAGVPRDTKKPWSGRKPKKDDAPFNAGQGKKVEETMDIDTTVPENLGECGDMDQMEESIHTQTQNGPQRRSTTISQVPDTSRSEKVGRNRRLAKKPGQVSGTGEAAYQGVGTNESFQRKLNKIVKENKAMADALNKFRDSLKEAAVVNYNLGKIISIISENTTTQDEKKEIIRRFNNEAKTINEADKLYESISNDLKKAKKMNINEEQQFTVEAPQKLNETTIYKSKDVLDSLDLMHRMMK